MITSRVEKLRLESHILFPTPRILIFKNYLASKYEIFGGSKREVFIPNVLCNWMRSERPEVAVSVSRLPTGEKHAF